MKPNNVIVRRRVSIHAVTYVLLLSISLAVLGVVGLHFTRSISMSLDQLRRETLPASSVMRLITREAGRMRRTVDLVDAVRTPEALATVRARVDDFKKKNDDNLKQLHLLVDEEELGRLLAHVVERRRVFLHDLEMLLQLAGSGATAEEVIKARQSMSTSYEAYRDEQDKLADYCETRAAELSGAILAKARRFEGFGVIIALWPVLAGVGLFAYGFLTTALVFFRDHRET